MTFLRDGDIRALEGHREIPVVNSFHPFFRGKKNGTRISSSVVDEKKREERSPLKLKQIEVEVEMLNTSSRSRASN